ncbi:MAG: hypothetical protein JOY84_20340 [Curvibacter sp.]|nr:hypothetical protein [Curvibacter sp.]
MKIRWLKREWRLRTYLAALLLITTVLTAFVVGSAILALRIPQLEQDSAQEVRHEAHLFASREDLLLRTIEERLGVIATVLQQLPSEDATALLDQAAGDGGTFRTLYLTNREGRVMAAGVPPTLRLRRNEMFGADLSGSPLVRLFQQRQQTLWGDKHLSPMTGELSLAVAYPLLDGRMLLAELPPALLLNNVDLSYDQRTGTRETGAQAVDIWLIDSLGDVVADTESGGAAGKLNLHDSPLMVALREGRPPPERMDYAGREFHASLVRLQWLDWYILARSPSGRDNRAVGAYVGAIGASFLGTLLVGLLLAPFWASGLVRSLNAIVNQAHQVAQGGQSRRWPKGPVLEFNRMSVDLEAMADSLQELNHRLEDRVQRRTQALADANAELAQTVKHLQDTRNELVRAEKMAALGSLVAGVAHELNTPLGNSLIAVTTLRDETRHFRNGLQEGLRRSALEALLESLDQATSISARNLQRAADLVSSFKQVAVDQTSSQRRLFELREVVDEIVITLRPSFSRTPYRISVDVVDGLWLDSYPGPLGQVLTNLITNAVVHGFDERDHGHIEVRGAAAQDGRVRLEVRDDGLGIAPALIERIFDPFMTTRMGRGGTGLGLNIVYNMTTTVLGGTVEVSSVVGQGSVFTLILPPKAPDAPRPAPAQSTAIDPKV